MAKWDDRELKKLKSMWVSGVDINEISETLGRSVLSVYMRLQRMQGLKTKSKAQTKCLSCRKEFFQEHKFNRVCDTCKTHPDYNYGIFG